jgi:hypothetical protein
MSKQQLEMNLDRAVNFAPVPRRRRRVTRARWWFAQMRQVVDRAWDWQPPAAVTTDPGGLTVSRGTVGNSMV